MSTRPIRPDDLLKLARFFVPPNPPPGRPRTAHRRRGVSLAYYALFHELVQLATIELCGEAPDQAARRWQASRWFAHTDLKALADAATGTGGGVGRAVSAVLGPPHPDVILVAKAFGRLQLARHEADYDHEYIFSRDRAMELVDNAARAIALARRLRRDGDTSFQTYLRLMVGAVKIARTPAR